MFFCCTIYLPLYVCLQIALLGTTLAYTSPHYKGYVYPRYTEVIGVLIGLLSVIPLPIMAVLGLANTAGPLYKVVLLVVAIITSINEECILTPSELPPLVPPFCTVMRWEYTLIYMRMRRVMSSSLFAGFLHFLTVYPKSYGRE